MGSHWSAPAWASSWDSSLGSVSTFAKNRCKVDGDETTSAYALELLSSSPRTAATSGKKSGTVRICCKRIVRLPDFLACLGRHRPLDFSPRVETFQAARDSRRYTDTWDRTSARPAPPHSSLAQPATEVTPRPLSAFFCVKFSDSCWALSDYVDSASTCSASRASGRRFRGSLSILFSWSNFQPFSFSSTVPNLSISRHPASLSLHSSASVDLLLRFVFSFSSSCPLARVPMPRCRLASF